jgi:hypothetical protein
MSDIKMIGSASALFKALGQLDDKADRGQTIEQRTRFYRLHPHLHFPEDWDGLSLDEKEKRLDMLDEIALNKESEVKVVEK